MIVKVVVSRYVSGNLEFESPRFGKEIHGLLSIWNHDGSIWIQSSYKFDSRNGARVEFEY